MTAINIPHNFALAVQLQNSGRLSDAEIIYRRILRHEPEQMDAICMLGVLNYQLGKRDEGVAMVRRAAMARPDVPDYWVNLGGLLAGMGNAPQAIEAFEQSLKLKPDNAEVWFTLAMQLFRQGRREDAMSACRSALTFRPLYPEVYCLLGDLHMDRNEHAEAAGCYRKALAQNSGGARMPVQWSLTTAQARMMSASLWPEYNGPPIDPNSQVGKAIALGDEQAPEPIADASLDFLPKIVARSDLPSAAEIFTLNDEFLPCYAAAQGPANENVSAKNLYPVYFGVFQELSRGRKMTRLLEIGVQSGFVGVTFAKAVQGTGVYVGIDPNLYSPDGLSVASESLKKLRDSRENFDFFLVEGFSWNEPEQHALRHAGPYDIIHIDGDHTLPGKLIDLVLARQLLAHDGWVLIDDYNYETHVCVKQAVARVLAMGLFKRFTIVPTFRGMAVLKAE